MPQAPQDPKQAFKSEWEALQLYAHMFNLHQQVNFY